MKVRRTSSVSPSMFSFLDMRGKSVPCTRMEIMTMTNTMLNSSYGSIDSAEAPSAAGSELMA